MVIFAVQSHQTVSMHSLRFVNFNVTEQFYPAPAHHTNCHYIFLFLQIDTVSNMEAVDYHHASFTASCPECGCYL